jgi:hypothetical protein
MHFSSQVDWLVKTKANDNTTSNNNDDIFQCFHYYWEPTGKMPAESLNSGSETGSLERFLLSPYYAILKSNWNRYSTTSFFFFVTGE